MRILFISQYNVNMFPALYMQAVGLVREGAQVRFLAHEQPVHTGVSEPAVVWEEIPRFKGLRARMPGIRSNFHGMLQSIRAFQPDWIVAQHEYLVPAVLYQMMRPRHHVRVAGYFCDYYTSGKGMALLKRLSHRLETYVDVCDLRLQWRREEWPRLRATPFIIRQSPNRRDEFRYIPHEGPVRVAFTSSRNLLSLSRERLSRFLTRLCERGISVDWYISGSSHVASSNDAMQTARSLASGPLYTVREPISKDTLLTVLGSYDVGLFWAPLAEQDNNRSFFISSASNKIGEYIAAGLVVAHTGNPGLSYLPDDVCAVFDPTDPEAGADQLAAQLSDRATVERKRQAAVRYHLDEMNFEAQAAPFIRHIMEGTPANVE